MSESSGVAPSGAVAVSLAQFHFLQHLRGTSSTSQPLPWFQLLWTTPASGLKESQIKPLSLRWQELPFIDLLFHHLCMSISLKFPLLKHSEWLLFSWLDADCYILESLHSPPATPDPYNISGNFCMRICPKPMKKITQTTLSTHCLQYRRMNIPLAVFLSSTLCQVQIWL